MGIRSIRIFLFSTFRDFGEERDLLVKRVFLISRQGLQQVLVTHYEWTGQADKATAYRAAPTRVPTAGK